MTMVSVARRVLERRRIELRDYEAEQNEDECGESERCLAIRRKGRYETDREDRPLETATDCLKG